jgi:hypothetical protein
LSGKRGSSGFRVANRGGTEGAEKIDFLLTVSHGDIIRQINSYHEGDHEGFGYFLLITFCALCGKLSFFVNFVCFVVISIFRLACGSAAREDASVDERIY